MNGKGSENVVKTLPNFTPLLTWAMSGNPIIAGFSSPQNWGRVKFGAKCFLYYNALFTPLWMNVPKNFCIFLCSVQKGTRTSPNPTLYICIHQITRPSGTRILCSVPGVMGCQSFFQIIRITRIYSSVSALQHINIKSHHAIPLFCFGDIMPSDWNILLIYYIQVILLPTSLHSNIYVPVFLPSD